MKMQNRDIQGAVRPLQQLITEKFPVSTSFALVRLVNKLNEPLKSIEDVRQGLIRKYHTVEGPMRVEEGTPQFEKFQKDFNELMDQEVDITFDKVKLPSMVDGHEMMIEPYALMALEKFIDLDDGVKPVGNRAERRRKAKGG